MPTHLLTIFFFPFFFFFSLIYPVRGTERDFARFFVLETVARVPYFAYLVSANKTKSAECFSSRSVALAHAYVSVDVSNYTHLNYISRSCICVKLLENVTMEKGCEHTMPKVRRRVPVSSSSGV